ncbi:MAG: NAD(P)/FAD-dependent oxidoreductase [Tissierellales bacterium]|jgi:glycerol-3-phosphate dehydrogenase|nr:NAD(P)/FAD-dependent oxidoreductase [Tissierellales bacterium]
MYDVVVIGAGVIGAAVSRELSKFNLKTIILEKTNDVACGTTKANSAIVHAGYDAHVGTNKGKFNALGNEMYGDVCKELEVPFKRIGSLVVAFDEEDIPTLEELLENGKELKIPGLEIIGKKRIKEMEPNLSDEIVAALYAPSAGIVEPWELAIAYAENAMDNGVELSLNTEVVDIEKKENVYSIKTNKGNFESKFVINCAGVYADKIYNMVVDNPEFEIKPRRGQYYLLDKEVNGLVNKVIFQCPTKLGKGVLVAPTVDGNVIVGPDAEDLDQNQKEATNTTGDRLEFVRNMALKSCADIPFGKNITTFAGLRAEPSTGDFIIGESEFAKNFINCAGIKSPGLSSAPAIACHIADLVEELSGGLEQNKDYNPKRRPRVKFEELNAEEKAEMIKKDSRYGRIICRCEMITEGEIVDAIHRNAGGRTLNGIKRRVRPGAGRCQGGFCGPRVMEILARELKMDMEDVLQENEGSKILVGRTKEI